MKSAIMRRIHLEDSTLELIIAVEQATAEDPCVNQYRRRYPERYVSDSSVWNGFFCVVSLSVMSKGVKWSFLLRQHEQHQSTETASRQSSSRQSSSRSAVTTSRKRQAL